MDENGRGQRRVVGGGSGHQAPRCAGEDHSPGLPLLGLPPQLLCRPRPVRQVSWGFFPLILKEALPRPTQLHTGVPFPPPSGPPGKGPRPGEVMPAPCGVVSRCIPERAAPGPGALLPRAQTSLAWLAGHMPHRAQQERKKGPGPGPCNTLSSCPRAVALAQTVGWARAGRAVWAAPCPKSTDT